MSIAKLEEQVAEKTPSQKYLYEILKPLQQENISLEYMQQLQGALEMDRRFRGIETLYSEIYSRISRLQTEISNQKIPS